jgi:TonB-linked SusC/RagA family outer membrane protein
MKKRNLLSDLASKFLVLSAFCILAFQTSAQSNSISLSGKVTDTNNQSLIGVNVVAEGTTIGTITDANGKWTLTIPASAAELKFSYIGYTDQLVKIGTEKVINIVMQESTKQIDELVVVGYGSVKKSDLTGSVSSVKADAIMRKPVSNVAQALQGLVPGVSVTSNSGAPGGSVTVRIRGVGTVNDPSPLYVVDGMPVNDISYLNSFDIESVEVLKDASATAIYGSRGANGVIMITTKKGSAKKNVITLNSYFGTQNINTDLHLLTGQQWYDVQKTINLTRTNPINLNNADPNISTNWLKEISQTGSIQSHNASFSGGNKDLIYNLSLGYLKQVGTVKKTDYDRINASLNLESKMNKLITIGTNITVSNSSRDKVLEGDISYGIINSAIKLEPVIPVHNTDGTWGYSKYIDNFNPVAQIAYTNSNEKNLNVVGNVYGVVNICKSLNFKSLLGVNLNRNDSYDFVPTYYVNSHQQSSASLVTRGYSRTNNILAEQTLNFNKTFNEKNVVGALLGFTAEQTRFENILASKGNTPNDTPEMQYLDAAQNASSATASGYAIESALISYIGRVNYAYDDRYLATATIRRDGSSRFGKSNQYGNFPSFALAWKLSNEGFFKNWNQNVMNSIKFRFGWGQVGNQNIGDYAFQNLLTASSQYAYIFGQPSKVYQGVVAVALGNADVKWESTESTNFGADFGFLKNKLTLSADYYNKTTKDMLLVEPIPMFLGFETGPTTNVGSVNNKGFEGQITWRDKIGSDFSYSIGANITTIKNEVLSLGTGQAIDAVNMWGDYVTHTKVGSSIGTFWGYKTAGLVQNATQLADVKTRQPGAGLGDVIFADVNGDGKLTTADKTVIGNPFPNFYYGFDLRLAYKGFDLSANFQGTQGNSIFNETRKQLYDGQGVTQMSADILNAWTATNTNTTMPRLNGSDANQNLRISDRYVEDGSYLRLKTLNLGYTFPQSIASKIYASSLRLYLTGQNLLTFTKYSGADPEIGQQTVSGTLSAGVDPGTYPQPKTITAGINLTF